MPAPTQAKMEKLLVAMERETIYRPGPGTRLDRIIAEVCRRRKRSRKDLWLEFNGTVVKVEDGATPEQVWEQYHKDRDNMRRGRELGKKG